MNLADRFRRLVLRITRWQYWPWPVLYLPILLQYFWHSLRFYGFGFPTLINRPFMQHGGILEESKLAMYQKTPRGWSPRTLALRSLKSEAELSAFMQYHRLTFPVIVKPDRGMRGIGVQMHRNTDSLLDHLSRIDGANAHLIQPYMDYPNEIGVFMIKSDAGWQITSLMERKLPAVTGDGYSTLEELVRRDDQLFLQLPKLHENTGINLAYKPVKGEEVILGHIGNHRLGTRFINRHDWLSPELLMAMGRICDLLKGFEYGRLDIRYRHWEQLLELRDFSVIEVNGANSEPAHIYDEGFDLIEAWQILLRHHRIIFHKARKAKRKGEKAPGLRESVELFRQYLQTMRQ